MDIAPNTLEHDHALIQIVLFFLPRIGLRKRSVPVAFRWRLH
jgi:hypothetical protein